MDADDFQSDDSGIMLNPGSGHSSSTSTSLSYSTLFIPAITEDKDEIHFPSYDDQGHFNECVEKPSIQITASSEQEIISASLNEHFEDDIAVRIQPFMAVDYLSHDWLEEDIWSSWKHLRSNKNLYPNSERLENACWRTWEKRRRNLRTIQPEKLKWLKDHDDTWLYGPLQPGASTTDRIQSLLDNYHASTSRSNLENQKPILKRPSLSELILRRSTPPMELLRYTATMAESQKSRDLAASTYSSFMFTTPKLTYMSTTSNTSPTPDNGMWNPKNVRFHEQVEQRIAVRHMEDDEPVYDMVDLDDDDVVVMRTSFGKKQSTQQHTSEIISEKVVISKTIERLPHATLKEPSEDSKKRKDRGGDGLGLDISSLAASQRRSVSSMFEEDLDSDDEDDGEEDEYWKPPAWLQNRKDSVQMFHDKLEAIKMHTSDTGLARDSSFLHRPILENRDEEKNGLLHATSPIIEGRDACITFELPPCRSQLASFSFGGIATATRHNWPEEPADPYSSDDGGWSENIDISHSTFDNFSTDSDTSLDSGIPPVPILNSAKTALVNQVMDEFWVVFNEWEISPRASLSRLNPLESSLIGAPESNEVIATHPVDSSMLNNIVIDSDHKPSSVDSYELAKYSRYIRHELPKLIRTTLESLVSSQKELDASSLISELVPLIHGSERKLFAAYQSTPNNAGSDGILSSAFKSPYLDLERPFAKGVWSLRTSSDSGYGSEERGEAWRVRDTSRMEKEKEKAMKNWDIYPADWDDLDEAVAWEQAF